MNRKTEAQQIIKSLKSGMKKGTLHENAEVILKGLDKLKIFVSEQNSLIRQLYTTLKAVNRNLETIWDICEYDDDGKTVTALESREIEIIYLESCSNLALIDNAICEAEDFLKP